ncbi:protein of unknown function [Nitrospina watsonii]|uniref:O-methyltransferase dimerisation domain-containing protein n=1 Tax=Nitrospina watsonii TaxID=1323948 RepID=A0ABN8W748_9BACT|nr:methyltransferase dimerization domain-containing protein [Nitrospina watsonii]CAI2719471.1 protein of unknown function [Nitrospina watsonii]
MTDPVRPDKIMQMGLGFWGSKVLLSAVELGVFTLIGKDSYPLETLSEKTGLHSRSAHDFFDTLVALGLLGKTNGCYSTGPVRCTSVGFWRWPTAACTGSGAT